MLDYLQWVKPYSVHALLSVLLIGIGMPAMLACDSSPQEPSQQNRTSGALEAQFLGNLPEQRLGFPSASEKQAVVAWLQKQHLNLYGDPEGTMAYAGGTPLFDEARGQSLTLYDYLVQKFPDRPWRQAD